MLQRDKIIKEERNINREWERGREIDRQIERDNMQRKSEIER